MKAKKLYIAPNIKVVKMENESLMHASRVGIYNPDTGEWEYIDIEEGQDPPRPQSLDSKGASPFSGDWEL
ncbi:MAG: hypothetical protein NC344_02995 [Bacteroidales bacterium]|nr:hypothetical protein [Bacteroidales bacterium]MCM1146799.1 hypothetical protein [Bacteroidales bacterium]MCM1205704.1 hypothetical protein [Bacillota bacterium]MCM1510766.1 hypothetical protein [Clostridium sp.]